MKQKEIVVGIDVSKATLDVCVLPEGEVISIKNEVKTIKNFFAKLQKTVKDSQLFIGMENTGYYNWPCYEVFTSLGLGVFVINPFHLKRSQGMVRGKNDKIDALRIARYIKVNKEELSVTLLARKEIRLLQALFAQRNRLIETKKRITVPVGELAFISEKEIWKTVSSSTKKVVEELKHQIKNIENQITRLISADVELSEKYKYLTSVQGVGKVLSWAMLIKTNEFKSLNDPRKLACYAGVVPFDFQSGTSVYKKPRVSNMADKTLKKLLHMAAMRAIQLKGDLQQYFQRKVAEGKNKMLILNNIRNKIVARICSVVKNKKIYEINLQLS